MQGRYGERCIKLCKGGNSETKVGVATEAVRSEGHLEIQMSGKGNLHMPTSSASFSDFFPGKVKARWIGDKGAYRGLPGIDPANAEAILPDISDRGLEVRLRDTFACRIACRRRRLANQAHRRRKLANQHAFPLGIAIVLNGALRGALNLSGRDGPDKLHAYSFYPGAGASRGAIAQRDE